MRSIAGQRAKNRISADQALAQMSQVLFQHFMAAQNLELEKMKIEGQTAGLEAEKVLRLKQLDIQAERDRLSGEIQRGELDLRKTADAREAKFRTQEMDLKQQNLALSKKTAEHGMALENMDALLRGVTTNQAWEQNLRERYEAAKMNKDLALDNAVDHYIDITPDDQISINHRILDIMMGGGPAYIEGTEDVQKYLRGYERVLGIPGLPLSKGAADFVEKTLQPSLFNLVLYPMGIHVWSPSLQERKNVFKVTRADFKAVEDGSADDATRAKVMTFSRYLEEGLKRGLSHSAASGEKASLEEVIRKGFGTAGEEIAEKIPKRHIAAVRDFNEYFADGEDSLWGTFSAEYKQFDLQRDEYRSKGPIAMGAASRMMGLMNSGQWRESGFLEKLQEVYVEASELEKGVEEKKEERKASRTRAGLDIDMDLGGERSTDADRPEDFDFESAITEIEEAKGSETGVMEKMKLGLEVGLQMQRHSGAMADALGAGVDFLNGLASKADMPSEGPDPVAQAANREAAFRTTLDVLQGQLFGSPGNDVAMDKLIDVGKSIATSPAMIRTGNKLKEGLAYIGSQIPAPPPEVQRQMGTSLDAWGHTAAEVESTLGVGLQKSFDEWTRLYQDIQKASDEAPEIDLGRFFQPQR